MREKSVIYDTIILAGMQSSVILVMLIDLGSDKSHLLDSILDFGNLPLFGIVSLALIWILNMIGMALVDPSALTGTRQP